MIAPSEPTDRDTLRLRNEFLSMPGLSVTVHQTARLLGVRLQHARDMLDVLERESFLVRDTDGLYRRPVIVAKRLENARRNL